VGGYASGPTLEVASRQGIPTLIQEQNSYAGVTNKLLAKKVKSVCVAYPKMERFFSKEKIVYTGNPVRADILNMNATREAGLKHFGMDADKRTICVFGGSLGAKAINVAMAAQLDFFKKHADVQVLWQAGKLYIDEYSQCEVAQLPNVQCTAFVDDMTKAYAMADIIIGRAGALTISELCLVGKPAVLIPSPNVAEDHQTHNAMALVENGAAVLIKNKDAKADILTKTWEVLNDANQCESLSKNILAMAKPNASKDIAEQVLKLVK